jgi:hypothetical protein
MFCPGCGREILGDRNFCNICGINLQAVQQAIVNVPTTVQPNQPQVSSQWLEIEKARHSLKKLALVLIGGGISLCMLLAMIAEFIGQFNWQASRIIEHLAPLGGLFIVVGIMTLIYRRIMYGAANAQVVVVQQSVQPQTPSPQPIALPAGTLPESFNSQNPPGRPLFQDMASHTARQEPIAIARQNHDPAYPYPPPTVTEHTTKELKRPQTKPTTNY